MYISYIHPLISEAYLWKNETSMINYHGYCTPQHLAVYLPECARFAISIKLTNRKLPILNEICELNVESYHGICDLEGFNSVTRINVLGTKRMPIINVRQPIAIITSYRMPPNIKQENVIKNRLINKNGMLKHKIMMRTVNLTTNDKQRELRNSMQITAR